MGEGSDRIPNLHIGWLRDTSRGSWHAVQSFQGEAKILTSQLESEGMWAMNIVATY